MLCSVLDMELESTLQRHLLAIEQDAHGPLNGISS